MNQTAAEEEGGHECASRQAGATSPGLAMVEFVGEAQRFGPVEGAAIRLTYGFPANWVKLVNQPQTAAEQEAMQISIKRNRPFGEAAFQQDIAAKLGLSSCFRDPWRPARTKENGA